jgi:hypothetical protein
MQRFVKCIGLSSFLQKSYILCFAHAGVFFSEEKCAAENTISQIGKRSKFDAIQVQGKLVDR